MATQLVVKVGGPNGTIEVNGKDLGTPVRNTILTITHPARQSALDRFDAVAPAAALVLAEAASAKANSVVKALNIPTKAADVPTRKRARVKVPRQYPCLHNWQPPPTFGPTELLAYPQIHCVFRPRGLVPLSRLESHFRTYGSPRRVMHFQVAEVVKFEVDGKLYYGIEMLAHRLAHLDLCVIVRDLFPGWVPGRERVMPLLKACGQEVQGNIPALHSWYDWERALAGAGGSFTFERIVKNKLIGFNYVTRESALAGGWC